MAKRRYLLVSLAVICILILCGAIGYHFYSQHKRSVAWSAINHYINKQGIKKEDIRVSSFFTEDDGQWHRFISVKDEKSNIAYEYIYKADIKKVFFSAERVDKKYINRHEWGGGGLDDYQMQHIKHPPLPNSYGYNN
ncbi:MAG: hypothetical protein ACE3JK_08060 [Sporolactobacillus sp.]